MHYTAIHWLWRENINWWLLDASAETWASYWVTASLLNDLSPSLHDSALHNITPPNTSLAPHFLQEISKLEIFQGEREAKNLLLRFVPARSVHWTKVFPFYLHPISSGGVFWCERNVERALVINKAPWPEGKDRTPLEMIEFSLINCNSGTVSLSVIRSADLPQL